MSFNGVQGQSTITMTEMSLFAAEADESSQQETFDSSFPEAQGGLKTPSKHYTFIARPHVPHAKEARDYILLYGSQSAVKTSAEKPSFMHLASKIPQSPFPSSKAEGRLYTSFSSSPQKNSDGKPLEGKALSTRASFERPRVDKASTPPLTFSPKGGTENLRQTAKLSTRHEKSERAQEKNPASAPLASRQWRKEETKEWWEARYHQRERQGGQKGDDQEQHSEQEEGKFHISKTASTSSKSRSTAQTHRESVSSKIKKPTLVPPKMGVFALYYILTKMGILSDGTSNFAYKKEIEFVDLETTETHKKRLDEVRQGIKKEKENARWGIAMKVFSWMGSMLGVITGIALVATGVGAVAGSMLIIGGLIQIANEAMEITGGWQKVAELLPGEDSEKKRAVINWMQIGITVICLVLSAAGAIWGGISHFQEATQTAMSMINGIATMGYGVTTIGDGISGFMLKDKLGDIKAFDINLAKLKGMRQDLMEKVEWGMDRLEQLFEDLSRALDFEVELFHAEQMINRR